MPNLAQAGGTAQLNVVLGDATGTVTGGVTAAQVLPYRTFIGSTLLSGLTYGSGGSVDTKTVTGTGATAGVTCTFAAPANAAAIVSQLNTAFGAGFAALGGVGNGYLVITGKLSGGTALAILGIVAPAVIRRVYTVGVTFQNNDTTNGAWLGPDRKSVV